MLTAELTYLESLPALVFLADLAGQVTFTNRRYPEFTGCTAEELLGKGLLRVLHPADRRGALAFDPDAPAGMLYRAEQRIRRHDGAWRYHLTQTAAVRNSSDRATAWVGCSIEIHTYRQTAAASRPASGPIPVRIPRGLETLVPAYLEERRHELAEFTYLLAAGDFEGIAQRSHKIKGSGTAFGFPDLTRIGAALEAAAKLSDLGAVEWRLEQLADFLRRVETVPRT